MSSKDNKALGGLHRPMCLLMCKPLQFKVIMDSFLSHVPTENSAQFHFFYFIDLG